MSLLVDPTAGWLGGLLGDALVGLLRRSPDERLLDTATRSAVAAVVAQVEERDREPVARALEQCFSKPPVTGLDPGLPLGEGLRAVVTAQVGTLREMVVNDRSGRAFFDTVAVTEPELASLLGEALWAGLRRAVADSGVPELVRAWQDEQVNRSLAELRELLIDLQASGGGRAPVGRLAVGVVPPAADCFQERQTAARLAEVLSGGGTAVLSGVLTGMGGVGKTQLAAAYARHTWANGDAEVMVWVTASSRPAIVAAYADAAHRLGAAPAGSDPEEAADRFLEWANTAPVRWLVVLDDIQDPADIRGLWPAPGDGHRVLATTRRRDAALTGQGRRRIDVDLFTPTEARTYLEAKLAAHDRTDQTEHIDALATDLGHLPLALAQAAAYLVDAGLGCAAYRERLADQRVRLGQLVPEEGSLPTTTA